VYKMSRSVGENIVQTEKFEQLKNYLYTTNSSVTFLVEILGKDLDSTLRIMDEYNQTIFEIPIRECIKLMVVGHHTLKNPLDP